MFTRIKTSKENKEIVSRLTRHFNLGKENTIARMAFAYSLSKDTKLNLKDIKDSEGKEYSKSVLFGEYIDIYIGMLCVHNGISKSNPEITKYVKLHLDNGLQLFNEAIEKGITIEELTYIKY